jgi:zinc protease
VSLLLVFALAVPPGLPARDTLPLDPAVTAGQLPNGLRYLVRRNGRPAARAELRLVVDAGSILEDEDQRGLAHVVEHMAFNGTRGFPRQALVDFLEGIGMRFGADLNAGTSFDETVYQLQVPTDRPGLLDQGLRILGEWAHAVAFDSLEVEKERAVVIEEWRLGQGAGSRLARQQLPVLFRGSRYADRLPIGTRESLESFTHAALRRFYRDWYRTDLMTVVAVGDFEPDSVVALIRRHLGALPPPGPGAPGRPAFRIPPRDSAAVVVAADPEATSASIAVYFLRPAREEGTREAFRAGLVGRLYARMLNDRLYELSQRPDPPFIGAGGGEGSLVRHTGAFSLGVAVADTAIARGLDAVLAEVERVERHGFTPAELDRARRDLLRAYERAWAERDRTESGPLAEELVRHAVAGEPVPGIDLERALALELLPEVTLEQVNRAASGWFGVDDRVVLVSAPERPGLVPPPPGRLLAAFDSAATRSLDPWVDEVTEGPLLAEQPVPAAIVAETVDTALGLTRWTLANGVRVAVRPTDFKADEVLLAAFSPGGTSLVPDSLFLAATLATQLASLGGLGAFSAVDLQKQLAGRAVQVTPYIGSYEEGLRGSASPRDLETLLQLVYLQFTAPRADPEAFAAFRANVGAALANRSASPEVAFLDTLTVTLARHHPRSRPLTAAIVDSLDLDRSLGVYRDRFADAGDFTFVFVGAVAPDSLRPLVQRYLGGLPARGRVESWRDVGIRPPEGRVEREVRRGAEPRAQTRLVLSGPFPWSREERFLLGALAQVLDIRLREVLREDLGGTYGVSVSAAPARVPHEQYTLSLAFGSDPDRVPELVAAVEAQLDSLRTAGPDPRDVAKVREAIVRTRETRRRENAWWLGQLVTALRDGEDPRRAVETDDLLDLLTPDRLRDAARRYLGSGNVVRVTLLPAP